MDAPLGYDRKAWLKIRNANCEDCKLHVDTDTVCQTGLGVITDDIWVVSKMPNSETYQKLIEDALQGVGIDPSSVYYTSALKCLSFDQDASRSDIKACKKYFEQEVAMGKPKWMLVFGNEALSISTGHSGITKYRTQVIEKVIAGHKVKVIPTISPAAVNRNPGQKNSWYADLQFLGS